MADVAAEYREKLLDAVVETDEGLMERYLEGQELDAHEVAAALKTAVTKGEVFPVACGVATKNLGTHALLDLLVEGVPSPAKKSSSIDVDGAATAVFVFKTVADPFAGRINLFRVLKGRASTGHDARQPPCQGEGTARSLLELQGKEHKPRHSTSSKATSAPSQSSRRHRQETSSPTRSRRAARLRPPSPS